jgi:transmembrane 9 superfamily member 2/4
VCCSALPLTLHSVKLKVNKLTSAVTLLPVEYYRLPFCQPPRVELESENLGEFLAGDRIENSPYVLRMKHNSYCTHLCQLNVGRGQQKDNAADATGKLKMMRTRTRTRNSAKNDSKMVKMIRHQYHANWIVDDLPSASISEEFVTGKSVTKYWQGFPIGFVLRTTDDPADVGLAYINNHVNIHIKYHKWEYDKSMYRVVQFLVEPLSIAHTTEPDTSSTAESDAVLITNPTASCKKDSNQHTTRDMANRVGPQLAEGLVLFTYDVIWIEDPTTAWSTRWDIYLNMNGAVPGRVHWISIANSLVIVVVLSSMIVVIVMRDINRYNKLAKDEETAGDMEDYGWRLVHADVFRPPTASPLLLAVMCGTGAQLLGTSISAICFGALGFTSPARRGHFLMGGLLLFVAMGTVAGFVTARCYKTFNGPCQDWQRATLCTAFGFPGLVFGVFLVLNIVAAIQGSSVRVPFFTMFVIIVLWFGVSTPLVVFGAHFGSKVDAVEFPVNISRIPRPIPDQPWFMGIPFTLVMGGVLPFGACLVELYYIMASAWMDFYNYVFGFLLLVFIILIITCAEIAVLFTYLQLRSENYHWWWRSFINGGSVGIYIFMYSIFYFQQLEFNSKSLAVATYMVYFGYMFLASLAMFMMMGCVGVTASLYFNKVIYSSIEIDQHGENQMELLLVSG